MRIRFDVLAAALGLVAFLASCSWTSNDINVNQAQGITQPSGPSPSPGAPCEIGSIRPGTARDVREIAQGATVLIGVQLLGSQGLPLADSCLGQYSPSWTGGAPCLLSGAGYDVALSAPDAAPLDAVCSATVSVGGRSGSVSLRVVAP
jgi:hypothetical protein